MQILLPPEKSILRLLVIAGLFLTIVYPAGAERFAAFMSRGPIPYVQGQLITVSRGRVTSGDYCNPAWGDCNEDGLPDLLLGSDYGDLVLYERSANGLFAPPQVMLPPPLSLLNDADHQALCPTVCDLDGDDRNDIVIGHGAQLFAYWGSESLAVAHRLQTVDQKPLFPSPVNSIAPEVIDFDGDGDLDIVAGDSSGRVWWIPNQSTGRPSLSGAIPLVLSSGAPVKVYSRARPTVGDFDGDGTLDVMVGGGDGALMLYRGTSSGLAEPSRQNLEQVEPTPISPLFADLNGNGAANLLIGDASGFVRSYSIAGGQLSASGYLFGQDVPFDVGQYAAVTSADYDGDGDLDVLAGGADGYIRVSFRNADGYSEPALITDGRGEPVRVEASTPRCAWPRVVDVDGNGTLDLVAGNANGHVELWLNHGHLQYAGLMKMAGSPIHVNGLAAIEMTDYDGDGDADLFVGCAPIPGTHISISDSALPQFVFPEGGLIYWENVVSKSGGMPVFVKAVRLLGFIGDGDEATARTYAGILGLRVIEPLELRHNKWSFLVGTARGWYKFVSGNPRSAYPTLTLPGDPEEIARAPIPALFSMTAVQQPTGSVYKYGLLCGSAEYGFISYYTPEIASQLFSDE